MVLALERHEAGVRYSSGQRRVTDGEIEIRQLFDLDDFAPSESVERFRELEAARKELPC